MENWKKYLEEELGEKVWSDRAPEGSRHQGQEKDTPLENLLYRSLYKFMNDNFGGWFSEEIIEKIKKFSKDPRYRDIIQFYKGADVYRGTVVTTKWLDENVSDWKQYGDGSPPEFTDLIKTSTEYVSRRKDLVSSWTKDLKSATDYAIKHGQERWKRLKEGSIPAVLIAGSKTHFFLDMEPVYLYKGLGVWSQEEEVIALGKSVPLKGIILLRKEMKKYV